MIQAETKHPEYISSTEIVLKLYNRHMQGQSLTLNGCVSCACCLAVIKLSFVIMNMPVMFTMGGGWVDMRRGVGLASTRKTNLRTALDWDLKTAQAFLS